MSDDIISGGILPLGDLAGDVDFDPNAVDSDAFLDDPKDDVLGVDLADGLLGDDDDELLDDE